MTIVARLHEPELAIESGSGAAPPEPKWKCVNRVAHITVGTRDDTVKPKESNDLLARWLEAGTDGEIQERVFEPKVVLKGTVRGVLSR